MASTLREIVVREVSLGRYLFEIILREFFHHDPITFPPLKQTGTVNHTRRVFLEKTYF